MSACNITTLQIWDTNYCADSVEWCPVVPYHNVFVCGTYHLLQNDSETQSFCKEEIPVPSETQDKCQQKKIGSLQLFVIDQLLVAHNVQTLELDAVLDTKWCRRRVEGKVLLAVATAKGEILIYELSENHLSEESKFPHILTLLTKLKVSPDEDVLALSLDWNVNKRVDIGSEAVRVVVSDSRGGVSLLKVMNSSLQLLDHWKVHEYEAWIATFDYWNSAVMYSGGDDNRFLVLDSRTGVENPVLVNKSHEMGVTSIQSNDETEYSLVSGSYDENLRFWDTRSLRKPIISTALIGGIWRLKWDPRNFNHLLAACMYGGFCIVNAEDTMNPDIIAIYKEHKSIAYGCDWCYWTDSEVRPLVSDGILKQNCDALSLIATCSFYDHKLCTSIFKKIS